MSSFRWLWYLVAVVAILPAIAVLVGTVYGDPGVEIRSTTAVGDTPTNATANCDDVLVREVTVSVTVDRETVGVGQTTASWNCASS